MRAENHCVNGKAWSMPSVTQAVGEDFETSVENMELRKENHQELFGAIK